MFPEKGPGWEEPRPQQEAGQGQAARELLGALAICRTQWPGE